MDDNKSWVQIKVTCDSKDAEVVEGVMSMVDNGLMIGIIPMLTISLTEFMPTSLTTQYLKPTEPERQFRYLSQL